MHLEEGQESLNRHSWSKESLDARVCLATPWQVSWLLAFVSTLFILSPFPLTMVDLSSGTEGGPIEHRFDNWIFVGPTVVVVMLVGKLLNILKAKSPLLPALDSSDT